MPLTHTEETVSRTTTVAARLEQLATAFLILQAGSAYQKPVSVRAGEWKTAGYGELARSSIARGFSSRLQPHLLARHTGAIAEAPAFAAVVYQSRAEDVRPWLDDHSEDVVYLDPPYVGCTGYAADCPREAVLDLAREWSAAGARVVVSESEPLPIEGWHHVEISDEKRRLPGAEFAPGKREWLTCSAPPRPIWGGTALFGGQERAVQA